MNIFKRMSLIAVHQITLLSFGMTQTAHAASLITTDDLANREGNSVLGFLVPLPSRFQQVYSASEFGETPLEISQIAWRPDVSISEPFDFTIGNIEFYLSTTSQNPDALSSQFEENISADYTKVFDGKWTVNSQNTGAVGSPKDFDILLNLTQPFVYDPKQGNLLVEYKKFTPEITGNRFDSEVTLGDSVSTVIAAGDANAVNANPQFSSTLGLVTQFKVTVVSEPSSLLSTMFIATFLGIGRLSYRSRQQKGSRASIF